MASTEEYIKYVLEQIKGVGIIRYKKMFGEYMVYVNEKPILLICDNTVYVKNLDCIKDKMIENNAELGIPYKSAKEHYILDIENVQLCKVIIEILEKEIPVPKPRKKKS